MKESENIMKLKELDKLFNIYIKIVDESKLETDNCIFVAHILNDGFKKLNIESNICIGYACWSVGTGINDILNHMPNISITETTDLSSIMMHAWIEIEEKKRILDFTTYQLKKKAQFLDAIDGFKTNVEWCPNYLYSDQSKLKSLEEIQTLSEAGIFGYQREKHYEDTVIYKGTYTKERIEAFSNKIYEEYIK